MMHRKTKSLADALQSLLLLVDDGDDSDDSGDDGDDDDSSGDDDGDDSEDPSGNHDPTEIGRPDTDFGDNPVGVSYFRLDSSHISVDREDDDSHDRTDFPDFGGDRPAHPGDHSADLFDPLGGYLVPGTSNLGAQLSQAGAVRALYESAVSELDAADAFQRTLTKSIDRALSPPIARAYLNLARPDFGPSAGGGILDEFWLGSYFSGTAGGGSANVSNGVWNRLGAASRYAGAAGVLFGAGVTAYNIVHSETPARTGVVELGRFSGSIVGGYLGGYAIGETAVFLLGSAGAVAISPWVGLGAAVIGSVLFASYGASTAGKVAEDLYNYIHQQTP